MHWMFAISRMLRLPNLLIVFLTQAIPYWYALRPALLKAGAIPALDERRFGTIALATMLTALAGYVINDYCDRHIDAINKPHRVVYGRWLPPSAALWLYAGLVVGVHGMAFWIDREVPTINRWPLWVFPSISFLLFLYAWQLKCTALLGNLLVSVLCASVPIIVIFAEERPIWLASFRQPQAIQEAVGLVWFYSFFAFVTNLLREQVKDLEDFQGDSACGCATLAVVKGPRFAKKPAGFTALSVCALLCILIYFWTETAAPDWQIAAGIFLLLMPALVVTYMIAKAQSKKDFGRASLCIKFIMVVGLFLLLRFEPSPNVGDFAKPPPAPAISR